MDVLQWIQKFKFLCGRYKISECLIPQLTSAQILYHPLSDHNICKIELRTADQMKIYKSNWRLNNTILNIPIYKQKIENILEYAIRNKPINNPTNIDYHEEVFSWYEKLKYKLKRYSKQFSIGRRRTILSKINELQNEISELHNQNPDEQHNNLRLWTWSYAEALCSY